MTHIFGDVGHTHGPLDQRFSVLSSALSSCQVLQHPQDNYFFSVQYIRLQAILGLSAAPPLVQDFVENIRKTMVPSRGRQLVCEVLTSSLSFKAFVDKFDVVVSGLVPNPRGSNPQPHTNHCWRFVRRAVALLQGKWLTCLSEGMRFGSVFHLANDVGYTVFLRLIKDLPKYDASREISWTVQEFTNQACLLFHLHCDFSRVLFFFWMAGLLPK